MAPLRKLATRRNVFAGSYPVVLERSPDGYFVAECLLFDGCYSQGKTESEAIENIREAILLCLEERFENASDKADFRSVIV